MEPGKNYFAVHKHNQCQDTGEASVITMSEVPEHLRIVRMYKEMSLEQLEGLMMSMAQLNIQPDDQYYWLWRYLKAEINRRLELE